MADKDHLKEDFSNLKSLMTNEFESMKCYFFLMIRIQWRLRRCLHVKFHPGMKLVPGWNHPCLWWNVSCKQMKFHSGVKDRDEISSQDETKRKRRVNTSSWACFFNFWRMYSSMFSKFSMFERNESMNIMKHKASL